MASDKGKLDSSHSCTRASRGRDERNTTYLVSWYKVYTRARVICRHCSLISVMLFDVYVSA
jgi:hypothetical protein